MGLLSLVHKPSAKNGAHSRDGRRCHSIDKAHRSSWMRISGTLNHGNNRSLSSARAGGNVSSHTIFFGYPTKECLETWANYRVPRVNKEIGPEMGQLPGSYFTTDYVRYSPATSSLVPQRLHRLQPGRSPRRTIARQQRYYGQQRGRPAQRQRVSWLQSIHQPRGFLPSPHRQRGSHR